MSINTQMDCPQCTDRIALALDAAARACATSGPEEIQAARDAYRKLADEQSTPGVLVQSCECFGAENGIVQIVYKCQCNVCGLGTSFTYSQKFYKERSI